MVVAAIALVIFYETELLNIWTVLICVFIVPVVNAITVGATHKKDVYIEDDI